MIRRFIQFRLHIISLICSSVDSSRLISERKEPKRHPKSIPWNTHTLCGKNAPQYLFFLEYTRYFDWDQQTCNLNNWELGFEVPWEPYEQVKLRDESVSMIAHGAFMYCYGFATRSEDRFSFVFVLIATWSLRLCRCISDFLCFTMMLLLLIFA